MSGTSRTQFDELASEVRDILNQNDAILSQVAADKELDAAIDLARESGRKADTVKTVLAAMRLALNELEVLRPLNFGREDGPGERSPVKLPGSEIYVRRSVIYLEKLVQALNTHLDEFTDEHETACAKVRELDPR